MQSDAVARAGYEHQVVKRLDLIVRLLCDMKLSEEQPPIGQVVTRLAAFGLASAEIAAIIGRKSNYVTAVLSRAKKRRGDNE